MLTEKLTAKKGKSYLSGILALLMMFVFSITAVSAKEREPIPGDVDLDSEVTVADATLIQKYLARICDLSDAQLENADTDKDGHISIIDATRIQEYLVYGRELDRKEPEETTAATQPTTQPTTEITAHRVYPTEPKETEPFENLTYSEKYAKEVLDLINEERAKVGAAPLAADDTLNEVAKIRAKEISTYFSHTRPDGSSCFSAIEGLNIKWKALGENIAGGFDEPTRVMNAWMHSEGHRANILNDTFEIVGIACYNYNGNYYWVQYFMAEW